jgi:hypothetical protein
MMKLKGELSDMVIVQVNTLSSSHTEEDATKSLEENER